MLHFLDPPFIFHGNTREVAENRPIASHAKSKTAAAAMIAKVYSIDHRGPNHHLRRVETRVIDDQADNLWSRNRNDLPRSKDRHFRMRNKKWVRLLAYVRGSVNAAERISGSGESYSEGEASDETALKQSRAGDDKRSIHQSATVPIN
jgi:hypothetical protein